MKIAPRLYDMEGNDTHLVRIELCDTNMQSGYGQTAKLSLSALISAVYFSLYQMNVFRGEGSIVIRMNISGAYKGAPRCIRSFRTDEPQVRLLGKVKPQKLKAFMNDVFVIHRDVLTFIPAEVLVSVNHTLGITR